MSEDVPFGTIKYLGFMVVPTEFEGKSPLTVKFRMTGSLLVKKAMIDFKDGSDPEEVDFEVKGEYMIGDVKHTFTYEKEDTKYWGHSFYPEFTVYGVDELDEVLVNEFNTEEKGRCLAIVVYDKNYVQNPE
jgi:hypothetical protein